MSQQVSAKNQLTQAKASLVEIKEETIGSHTLRDAWEKCLQLGKQITEFIDIVPLYWTDFWQAYKRMFTLLTWIFSTLVAVKFLLAVIGVVHSIPLLTPLLQLIGFAYTVNFVARHVVGFVSRQNFITKIQGLRDYIFG